MRFPLLPIALICAAPAYADVISATSKVTDVTMHPDSVSILRKGTVQIPSGQHRLVLRGIPISAAVESLRVEVAGVRRIGTVIRENHTPPHDPTSPEVQTAKDRIEDIEQQIQAVRNQALRDRLNAEAANVSIEFLRRLGDNEGMAGASAETLQGIARMIREEAAEAGQTALDAEIKAEQTERQLQDLNQDLEEAQQALRALDLEDRDRLYVAVEIETDKTATTDLTVEYLVVGTSGWAPAYDLHLATGDQPQIDIVRSAMIRQETGENWEDVRLSLTTQEAAGQVAAWNPHPRLRRIEEPAPVAKRQGFTSGSPAALLSEPVAAPLAIVEETTSPWNVRPGAGVTLRYDVPVSVASSAETLKLELDTLTEQVEVTAVAVPLHDATAFRMAKMTNTSGQELLAGPFSARYVDGELVGIAEFSGMAAGQEARIGFGPIDGLRAKRDILNATEGDRGILTRSNQRADQVEIEIENLTAQDWSLRVLDRVPYSQQEDLEIDWTARPKPSEQNVDKKRGILAWDMELASGQAQTIRLDTTLSWPEGMVLR